LFLLRQVKNYHYSRVIWALRVGFGRLKGLEQVGLCSVDAEDAVDGGGVVDAHTVTLDGA